eukprot:TRINITY_DN17737_c0_g1_i1.p2 TRINITY_DN17737_c0_g1~~TRINITY_DN17737_c0_g1_i1.p2  ORF type:complete len:305 (+),score=60.24 TRINITY_DN17737_c0_g1_i1:1533-2447(+)
MPRPTRRVTIRAQAPPQLPPEDRVEEVQQVEETPPEALEPEYTDEYLFNLVKPHLNQVCALSRKKIQEVDEKIARRQIILDELMNHQDQGTIPKSIVVPRMPQVPGSQVDEFSSKFKALSEQYAKDTLDLLLKARAKDLKALAEERKSLYAEAIEKVEDALQNAYNIVHQMEKSQMRPLRDMYEDFLIKSLEKSRLQTELKSAFGTFVDNEKKNADLLKRSAAEADEEETSDGVDRLRKEMKALKKDINSLKNSHPPHTKTKQKGNTKTPKTGQKNKGGNTKNKGKPKSKNGKQGAAGRGAKQN